jgi:hypothetical protein
LQSVILPDFESEIRDKAENQLSRPAKEIGTPAAIIVSVEAIPKCIVVNSQI